MQTTEKFFAASVIGESHIESGKPVQDYSLAVRGEGFCLAVVCDGHGGEKHFRSEYGSRFAAEAARDALIAFYAAYSDWEKLENGREQKLERLKIAILAKWQTSIEEHARKNPFTEDELKKVSSTFKARNTFDIGSPYGTTLLLSLVCNDYYLAMMLGDGAVVKFTPDFSGKMVEFQGKEKFDDQPHSATESMCDPRSYDSLYHICERCSREEGIAIALCSDGMSEAFSDGKVISTMANYINFVAEEGIEESERQIPPHLRNLSKMSAAKDDVSFAFATVDLSRYDKRNPAKNEQPASAAQTLPEEQPKQTAPENSVKEEVNKENEQ